MLKAPKFWYQNKISILAILLLPISLLWIIGTLFKKKFAKPIRSKIPVIAVGALKSQTRKPPRLEVVLKLSNFKVLLRITKIINSRF